MTDKTIETLIVVSPFIIGVIGIVVIALQNYISEVKNLLGACSNIPIKRKQNKVTSINDYKKILNEIDNLEDAKPLKNKTGRIRKFIDILFDPIYNTTYVTIYILLLLIAIIYAFISMFLVSLNNAPIP